MNLNSLQDVLAEQVQDLWSAEEQLVQALPKLARAASSDELRKAFEQHLQETRGHVERLEEIVSSLGLPRTTAVSQPIKAMVAQTESIIASSGDDNTKDAALIAAAQRVEHYEIAGYGTARTLADHLGYTEERDLLDESADEEGKADKLLTKIATGGVFKTGVNQAAARR